MHVEDLEAVTRYFQRRGMDKTTPEAKVRFKGMFSYGRTKSRPMHEMIVAVRRMVEVHTQLNASGREQGKLPLLTPTETKR